MPPLGISGNSLMRDSFPYTSFGGNIAFGSVYLGTPAEMATDAIGFTLSSLVPWIAIGAVAYLLLTK